MKKWVSRVFKENNKAKETTIVNVGGARSSKSHSILQFLIYYYTQPGRTNRNILLTRKTYPALRMTLQRMFFDILKDYQRYNDSDYCRSGDYYTLNGNRFQFSSLDNPEKIKSTEFNHIFMEEANEFTWNDYIIFLTRLSGKHGPKEINHIILSLNPSDANGWIPKKLCVQKDVKLIRSTYKDNKFIDKKYVDLLENLKNVDLNTYKIYALGEWGSLVGRIYKNYDFPTLAEWPKQFDSEINGIDFGFNHPTTCVHIGVLNKEAWISEKIYESGLTTNQLGKKLEGDKGLFICDSAEPDRIKSLKDDFHLNVRAVEKGPNSVKQGIDYCQQWKIHVHPEALNVKKEIESYNWKLNKNEEPTDEPVEFNDDAMDAMRYALVQYRGVYHLNTRDLKGDVPVKEEGLPGQIEYEKTLAGINDDTYFVEGLVDELTPL